MTTPSQDKFSDILIPKGSKTPEQQRARFYGRILAALSIIVLMVTVIHLAMYVIYHDVTYAVYLIGDTIALLICLAAWEMQRSRTRKLAAILLLSATTLLITIAFPLGLLDRMFLLYTIPVILASIIISPRSSFIFALFATIGYTVIFLLSPRGLPYNYLAICFLFLIAGMAYLVTNRAEHTYRSLSKAYDASIEGWRRTLDERVQAPEGHADRLVDLTLKLAAAMGLPESESEFIRRGVLLHDVGKMAIPDKILLKKGKLTEWDWEVVHMYPTYAYQWMSSIEYLRPALDIPHYHQEHWDGTGYPDGLKGEQIPLAARIFAVVYVWDALRTQKPYREAWTDEKARQHLRDQAGHQFDPKVVEAFLKLV
jgi:HD-GYP domain-containing protein (c-di-GMP phosphodiesterase class II)